MLLKILLAGDGGQGIQTIADIICRLAFENDFQVTMIPNYGLEQRGGVSLAYIKISDEAVVYPKFSQPDVLLIMSTQARARTAAYQVKDVKVLNVEDYEKVFFEEKINPSSRNIFFLGVLAKILEKEKVGSRDHLLRLMENKLSKKPNWEENKKAFKSGYQI